MPLIQLTEAAKEDLINIWSYTYREWGEDQANHYLDVLEASFEMLAENPQLYRLRTELEPAVRIHRVNHHLVIYLETESGIQIIRVLHKNMDYEAHLDEPTA